MIGIGTALKKAREELGFSLEEMQKKTNIQADYLQSLEEERFEQLPSPFYARGFLRAYAKSLRLDWRYLLDLYEKTLHDDQNQPTSGIVTDTKLPDQSNRTESSKEDQRLTMSKIETFVPRRELLKEKRRKKKRVWWTILSISIFAIISILSVYLFLY